MKDYSLTAEDLAKNFKVPERTVYYWASDKGLPHIRIGKLIRFNRQDVDNWIVKQQDKTKEVD